MLEILEIDDFDQMYRLMQASFPQDEYRPDTAQMALFDDPAYRVYAHYGAGHTLWAFLSVWDFDDFAFIEHLAVKPECRGSGLGSRLLQDLCSLLSKPICLEVELPDSELARRRIGFYQRNGFCLNSYAYIQPAMAEGQNSVPLRIMSFPNPVTSQEFTSLRNTLYRRVYQIK